MKHGPGRHPISTTDLTDRDQSVIEQLEKLPRYDHKAHFARALELGASDELLRGIATSYLSKDDPADEYRVTGLPYIDVLLAGGWGVERVRQFVFTMLTTTDDLMPYHQEGFLNSDEAWRICQTQEQLMEFMQAVSAQIVLKSEIHKRLIAALTEFHGNAEHATRDLKAFEDQAVRQLEHIETAHQFTIVLRTLPHRGRRDRIALAHTLHPTGWNLACLGYILAMDGERELYGPLGTMRRWLDDCPWQGADMLRWLIMGYQLREPKYWFFRLEGSTVWQQFAEAGWHIVQVTATPNGQLQATVSQTGGQRITLIHQPGEPLQAGSRVIVSQQQLEKLTPRHTPGGMQYTLPLTPAAPPTEEQLANPGKVFYADPHGTHGLRKVTVYKAW